MQGLAEPTAERVAWGLVVATALISLAGLVLTVIAWSDLATQDAYPTLAGTVAAVVYAALGALIIRRAGNRIGWLLLGEGLVGAIQDTTSAYAVVGVATHPGLLPAANLVGAFSEWVFVPIVMGLGYMLLIFPTGSVPSRRWRPVSTATIAITSLALVGFIVT